MNRLDWNEDNLADIADYLLYGHTVVIPTDTLYGVLALADNDEAVNKVYKIKGRDPDKPAIILIGDFEDPKKFDITLSKWQEEQVNKFWPGKVSIILACNSDRLFYLHRGTRSLAFRLPDDPVLRKLLKFTGPLIAPSANPEGADPALVIEKAQEYFGEQVTLYADAGERRSEPSTLISLVNDEFQVLRGNLP